MQGRTDSGHLFVMDPTDMMSTGARGFGGSPQRFEMTETGEQGAAGFTPHDLEQQIAWHKAWT